MFLYQQFPLKVLFSPNSFQKAGWASTVQYREWRADALFRGGGTPLREGGVHLSHETLARSGPGSATLPLVAVRL